MEFASKGVAGTGLGLGIAGTALGVLNSGGLLGNLLGGMPAVQRQTTAPAVDTAVIGTLAGVIAGSRGSSDGSGGCSEDHKVNRYEAAQAARIAELETEVKLRDANTYTDQKLLEVYKYFDGQLKDVRSDLCGQKVHNQRTEDSFVLARQDIAAVKAELIAELKREAEKRCCGDNAIVNYSNATFYPKQVADVETGTGTTAQALYNPLPKCGECCGN